MRNQSSFQELYRVKNSLMNWRARRIVIVGPAPPYRGGIAQFVDGLASHLHPRHQVSVLSFCNQYPSLLFPGRTQRDNTRLMTSIPCTELLSSINPMSWHSCGKWLANHQPDLVLINHWMPYFGPAYGAMIRTMKRRHSARVIFICHNVTPHEPSRLDGLLTRYALNTSDGFLVMSEEVRRDVIRFRPKVPVQLSPLPLNESFPPAPPRQKARAELRLSPEARVLLFFGLVRAYKGLDVLLRALALLREKFPVSLLISGEFYQSSDIYLKMISDLGLSGLVQVHAGFVPPHDVGRFFAAADAVVLPYKTATQSGVSKMAYYFDRPVIVSDVGGLPNEIEPEQTGVLARPDDPGSLAQAIKLFFTLATTVNFVENVRRFKLRYDWNHFLSALGTLDGENSVPHSPAIPPRVPTRASSRSLS
jgi:D-inositol-3-phosphate glycosyltransferase